MKDNRSYLGRWLLVLFAVAIGPGVVFIAWGLPITVTAALVAMSTATIAVAMPPSTFRKEP